MPAHLRHRSANVTASRAERFAETLTSQRGPWDTMGHLLHMPSHTFQRIGRYVKHVLHCQLAAAYFCSLGLKPHIWHVWSLTLTICPCSLS